MNTDSAHLILDLWMDEAWDDQWVKHVEAVVDQTFTVVQKSRHQFEPHGETVAFILSESHFTLHSYPEENYISLDIYICRRDFDFLPLIRELEAKLPISKIHHRTFRRGEYALPWLQRWHASEKGLILATFVVAACSLFYELMLAQTLSAILGDTAHRYNVTIGLYIASMGLGALLYEKLKIKNLMLALVRVEVILALIGALAPLLALIWDYLWRDAGSGWSHMVVSLGLHGLIVAIGLLSGLELPLLMDMGEKKREGFGTSVLAIDYAGTLSAAILFPLILMPLFQLFSVAGLIAGINAFVAAIFALIAYRSGEKLSKLWLVAAGGIFVLCGLVMLNEESFARWAIETFYLGGAI